MELIKFAHILPILFYLTIGETARPSKTSSNVPQDEEESFQVISSAHRNVRPNNSVNRNNSGLGIKNFSAENLLFKPENSNDLKGPQMASIPAALESGAIEDLDAEESSPRIQITNLAPSKMLKNLTVTSDNLVSNLTLENQLTDQSRAWNLLLWSIMASRLENKSRSNLSSESKEPMMRTETHQEDMPNENAWPFNGTINDYQNRTGIDNSTDESVSESRALFSWLERLITGKKKRPPARYDKTKTSTQRLPIIKLLDNHQKIVPMGQMASNPSKQTFLPNFLPNPDGFPGPLNPDSILIPPELMQNTGIEYWLDFIEKPSQSPDRVHLPSNLFDDNDYVIKSDQRRNKPSVNLNRIKIGEKPDYTYDDGGYTYISKDNNNYLTEDEKDFNKGSGANTYSFPDPNENHYSAYNDDQSIDHHSSPYASSFTGSGNSYKGLSNSYTGSINPYTGSGNSYSGSSNSFPESTNSFQGFKTSVNKNQDANSYTDANEDNYEPEKLGTSPRCDKFTPHICVDDFEYPEQAIVDEIYKRKDIFELMYSDVKENVPLVDGIPRDVEESYNYEHYYDPETGEEIAESGSSRSSSQSQAGGFICPSEVLYGKPKLAKNRKGDWKVIVNAAEFTQTVRMEKCLKPNRNCNYINRNAAIDSKCVQVHSFHRLMVFEKGKGFYIDTFRIPTACSCHVVKRPSPPVKASNSFQNHDIIRNILKPGLVINKNANRNNAQLSNTLWSILGSAGLSETGSNGGNSGSLASSSTGLSTEDIRNSLSILEQLKNYPQFASVSPANVLQQLTNLQTISGVPSSVHNLGSENSGHSYPLYTRYSNKANSNQHQNSASNEYDYFLPGLMYTEDRLPSSNLGKRKIYRYPQKERIHSTTTYLNPGNQPGAPVVQVIHVPVSSHALPSNGPVYKPTLELQSPYDTGADYSASDPQSWSDKSSNKDLPKEPKPLNMEPSSSDRLSSGTSHETKTTTTTTTTHRPSGYLSSAAGAKFTPLDSDNDSASFKNKLYGSRIVNNQNTSSKSNENSSFNKRINFNYHPILDFISPSKNKPSQK